MRPCLPFGIIFKSQKLALRGVKRTVISVAFMIRPGVLRSSTPPPRPPPLRATKTINYSMCQSNGRRVAQPKGKFERPCENTRCVSGLTKQREAIKTWTFPWLRQQKYHYTYFETHTYHFPFDTITREEKTIDKNRYPNNTS